MSTFGDLISDVESMVRETTVQKDTFLLQAAGRLYLDYLRADNWPQERAMATVTTVSGQSAYDLPATFDRFAGDRVFYSLYSNTVASPFGLPILTRGTLDGDRLISYWQAFTAGTTQQGWPAIVTIQAGGANTYQLVFYPGPVTADSFTYEYYVLPFTRATLTTNTTIIEPLYNTMVQALAAEYFGYINDAQNMGTRMQLARAAHRVARMTLQRL